MIINYTKEISSLVQTLDEYGFRKRLDTLNEYSNAADLYYRKIDNNRYIVFNHYNKKQKFDLQGFDCWISTYKSEDEIGSKKAVQIEEIRLSFRVERDWVLITPYLRLQNEQA